MRVPQDAIDDAIYAFESEWGNLEHTTEVIMWSDGDWQVEVYHTAGRHTYAGVDVVRRIGTLLEPGADPKHREYMVTPRQIHGDILEEL